MVMKELILQLKPSRRILATLLIATIGANALALVSSLYSIHVMNRYMSMGVDATLVTLTVGALIALVAENLLRSARLKLTAAVLDRGEAELSMRTFTTFASSRLQMLEQLPTPQRREALAGLTHVQQFLSAATFTSLMDAPFALLFLFVLSLLSPMLALAGLFVIICLCAFSLSAQRSLREPTAELSKLSARTGSMSNFLATGGETVRAFNCYSFLAKQWREGCEAVSRMRQRLGERQAASAQLGQSGATLLTITIYAVGARAVVHGQLDVGSLVGASILASRAMSAITRLVQLAEPYERARQSLQQLDQLARVPSEKQQGVVPRELHGAIEIQDLAFGFNGQPMPLFESMNLNIRPGGVLAVVGNNGSGKTTLLKLLAGLIEPQRGHIRIDHADLRHVVPEWWRKQLVYLPQEPQFFDGTLRENLSVLAPDISDPALLDLCRKLDLTTYLNQSADGLDMAIRNGGAALPVGIRRRLALVRALAGEGRIVLLDEPTDSVDARGIQSIAVMLNELVKRGSTVIIATREEFIIKAAEAVLDLNSKPVPSVVYARDLASKPAMGAAA